MEEDMLKSERAPVSHSSTSVLHMIRERAESLMLNQAERGVNQDPHKERYNTQMPLQ